MLRSLAAAAALVFGLGVGVLAGWQDSNESSAQALRSTDLALPCFEANEMELRPFRIVLHRESYGPLQFSTTASAKLRGVDPEWREATDLAFLGDCILADTEGYEDIETGTENLFGRGVLGEPAYEWDSTKRELVVDFGEQTEYIEIDRRSGPSSAANSRTRSVVAYQEGGTLVVEIDPCPEQTDRLVCSRSSTTQIELVVPAELMRGDSTRLSYNPLPTGVSMVEGETVLAWLFEGDPARVRIEIALPWVVAMEALLSRGGPIEIDHPLALVSISLGGLLHLSTIAIFFVGWLVVGGLSRASRRYWLRLAGLYALLGTVAFVSIQPAGVPLLDLDAVIPAIVWAAIWLLLSWTRMAMAGALLGVGSVVGGALLGQDWMQAVAVLSLAAVGLSTVGRRLVDATDVWPGPGLQPLPGRLAAAPMRLKPAVLSLSALALLVGLGSLVGAAMGSQLGSRFGFDGLIVSELISGNLAFVMFAIAGLVVVGAVLFAIPRDAPIPMCDVRLAVAFLFSVLVPPASVAWAGIGMPTWLVTLLLVGLAVTGRNEVMAAEIPESGTVGGSDREGYGRRERGSLLAEAVNRELAMNRLDETDAGVSTGAASLADVDTARAAVVDRHPTDVTGQFLARGVHGHWFENARLSAWVGGLLALIPLAGFVWGAAESAPDQLSWNGLLYLVLGVLTEYAGWVVAAFAFGALYAFLPGRLGPVKGACLAGIWAASALLTELLSRWVTDDASDTWLFVSLRMFLFLVAVGSSVDFLTVKAAGGTYRRLADIYRVSTHKRWFAYIGPLVLAVVALIQQVSAGANADTAEAVINSVSRLLGG